MLLLIKLWLYSTPYLCEQEWFFFSKSWSSVGRKQRHPRFKKKRCNYFDERLVSYVCVIHSRQLRSQPPSQPREWHYFPTAVTMYLGINNGDTPTLTSRTLIDDFTCMWIDHDETECLMSIFQQPNNKKERRQERKKEKKQLRATAWHTRCACSGGLHVWSLHFTRSDRAHTLHNVLCQPSMRKAIALMFLQVLLIIGKHVHIGMKRMGANGQTWRTWYARVHWFKCLSPSSRVYSYPVRRLRDTIRKTPKKKRKKKKDKNQ